MAEESRSFLAKLGLNTKDFTKGVNETKAKLTELNAELFKNKREQKSLQEQLKELEKKKKDNKRATEEEKKAYEELIKKVDKATIELAELQTQETLLRNEVNAVKKALKEQTNATDDSEKAFQNVGKALKTAAQFTATAVAGMFTYTTQITATAGEIDDLAKQTGLTVEEIQKLMYAAELSGTTYDTITGAMAKLVKNMATAQKGTGDAADAFKALKVDVDDSTGVLRDNQDVFDEVIAKLGKIEDETQRDAYAMAIFGKSAQDLNPLILGGTEQLKAFGDELEREGLLLSQTELDKLNEFDDKWVQFQSKLQAGLMGTGSEAVDAFDELFEMSDEIISMISKVVAGFAKASGFIVDHKEAVLALVVAYGSYKAAMGIGSLISSVVTITKSLTTVTQGATVAQQGMNAACNANPYVLLASALAAVVGGIVSYNAVASKSIEDITSGTDRLKESITSAVAVTQSEVDIIKKKANRYEELRKKLNRTAKEEKELYEIAADLETSYPNQIELIGDTAGAYKELGDQVSNLTEKMLEQARTQASLEALQQAYADRYTYASQFYSSVMNNYEDYKNLNSEEAEEIMGSFQEAWNEFVASNYNLDALSKEHQLTFALFGGGSLDAIGAFRNEKSPLDVISTEINGDEVFKERAELLLKLEDNQTLINNLENEYSSLLENSSDSTIKLTEETENQVAALMDLAENTKVVNSAEEELVNTGKLSEETLNAIAAAYPAVQDEINDYINHVGTAEDVINHLNIAYRNDVVNNKEALQAKLNTDTEYYEQLQSMNNSAINKLANEYGLDLSNYESYGEAKLAIQSEFLSKLAANWQKYYDAKNDTYIIDDRDLMQYKKELMASGMTSVEADDEVRDYINEQNETQKAVNAWNRFITESNLTEYSKWYTPQLLGDEDNDGEINGGTTQKETSIYEQANEAYKKLVNDRIEQIQKLTDAENAATDERIAAIEKEIAAREKLKEETDLQEQIDYVQSQLKYSQLEEFEQLELERKLKELKEQQSEQAWLDVKNAEIEALEAEKTARDKETADLVEQLKANQEYAGRLFTDLNNGYQSVSSIVNNNSQQANFNIITQGLSKGQVEQEIKDKLGLGMLY